MTERVCLSDAEEVGEPGRGGERILGGVAAAGSGGEAAGGPSGSVTTVAPGVAAGGVVEEARGKAAGVIDFEKKKSLNRLGLFSSLG